MFFYWMGLIAIVSVIWAFYALKKEKEKHEIEKAREEMTKGRVIFHSSSVADETESSL